MTQVKDDGSGCSTVYVLPSEDSARACFSRGVFATRLKGFHTTGRIAWRGRPVSIRWPEARWYCTEPACERGSFTEAIRQVATGMRTALALRQAAGAAVCDGSRTAVQADRDLHLSWPIVQHCFQDYAAQVLPQAAPTTSAISAARHRFFAHVADHAHLPELVTLAETVEQRWDGIETYLATGITNPASMSNNRLMKLEAGNASEFRNRANQRLHSRCATARRSRRDAHSH